MEKNQENQNQMKNQEMNNNNENKKNPMADLIENMFKKVAKETEDIKINDDNYIEKKVVAEEIIKNNNNDIKNALFNIMGVFLIYSLAIINKYIAFAVFIPLLVLNTLYLFRKRKYSLYLKNKYNLNIKIIGGNK